MGSASTTPEIKPFGILITSLSPPVNIKFTSFNPFFSATIFLLVVKISIPLIGPGKKYQSNIELEDLETGTYTLKVDEQDGETKVDNNKKDIEYTKPKPKFDLEIISASYNGDKEITFTVKNMTDQEKEGEAFYDVK